MRAPKHPVPVLRARRWLSVGQYRLCVVRKGDFLGTPTANCIDGAMKNVQFPRTQKASTKVGFPIVLQ
jgi:hypothetical protein